MLGLSFNAVKLTLVRLQYVRDEGTIIRGNQTVKKVVTWLHLWHLSSSGNDILVSFFGDLKYIWIAKRCFAMLKRALQNKYELFYSALQPSLAR